MDPDLIDPNLVFAKTASGEEAVLQRTRVVQRNTRMVLILVDGNATVAELCDRTGNPQMTRSALLELESDGLVDRRTAVDSVWQRSDKAKWRAAADETTAPVSEFSTFGGNQQTPPGPSSSASDDTPLAVEGAPASQAEEPPQAGRAVPAVDDVSPSESGTVFFSRAQAGGEESAAPAADAVGQASSVFDRWRPAWLKAEGGQPSAQARANRPRFLVTWPLVVILILLLPLVLVLLLKLIFPYLNYQPVVEAALRQSTGRTASVDEMGIDLLPTPGLLLNGVRLVAAGDGPALVIRQVRLRPALTALFAEKILFDDVELSGLVLSPMTIADLAQILESTASPSAQGAAQHVSIENAELAVAGLAIGDLRGEISVSSAGLLQAVSLHSANRNLTFDAQPLGTGFSIAIEGLKWSPDARSRQAAVESFVLQGELHDTTLAVERMEFRVFGGLLTGKATLRAVAEPVLSGELAFERINAKKLAEALGVGIGFLGEGTGKLRFSAAADAWPSLLSTLRGDGTFTIRRGSLPGIDLPEALRRAPTVPLALGGATRFEQLSGVVSLTPGFVHFSQLNLSAGAMQSAGHIDIGRDLDVRGRMDVEMRGRGSHAMMPVTISGSLNAPLLKTADR